MNVKDEILQQTRWATVGRRTVGNSQYLTMETAPAACVLLYDDQGDLWLIRQQREDALGESLMKTVGGYLAPDETHEQCLTRNLLAKAGIQATAFTEISRTFGYGGVVRVPIKLYACRPGNWERVGIGSCELVEISPDTARNLISDPILYDDATRLQILLYLIGER